ncbi:MAG: D-alanine--D-alanine ligase [Buchnera aphidicola (Kaburagia rhusicola rhusicola)]
MIEKVAVLFGGTSKERNISLLSGKNILKYLFKSKINAYPIDTKYFPITQLPHQGFKKAFIALHGKEGEDGTIQGLLTHLKIAYTGSKILPSAISIDKIKTKLLWKGANLPVVPCYFINIKKFQTMIEKDFRKKILMLGLPVIVKPNTEGSSIGISLVYSYQCLYHACKIAFQYDNNILIEKFIRGSEYSVGILEDKILPSIRISSNNDFYDYESKYISKKTKYFCPSGLKRNKEIELNKIIKIAWNTLGCIGWGRIDLIMDRSEKFWLLEMNTCPGMTKNSLMPIAAKNAGISLKLLVLKILQSAN